MEKIEKPKIYRKHHSFSDFYSRSKSSIKTQTERVINFIQNIGLNEKDTVLASMYRNIFDDLTNRIGTDEIKFDITEYIATELSKLDDAQLPRYLHHRYRYDINPNRYILDDYPPYVQIEPSSVCNFRCVFCYQTDESFNRKSNGYMGTMGLDLFKSIIDKIEDRIEFLSLSSRGEPFLCKDIDKMLEYCVGKFLNLKINTNASLLTEKHAHSILSGAVQTLVFSADAAEEPLYSQLRVNGKLDKTVKNIEMFKEIKEKYYPDSKIITRVSGVMYDERQDSEKMHSFWSSIVDQVAFVKYNPWENVYESAPNSITTPCSDLWRRMFIWFDGKVNPCDTDYKSTLSVGNIKDNSVMDLWHSKKYQSLREAHRNNKRQEVEPCRGCVVT